MQVILTMAKTVLVRSVKCFLDIGFSESASVHDVMPCAKATQTHFVIDKGHLFVVFFVCYTVLRNMLCVWLQFNKEAGKKVHEAKLRVLYVSPPQPPSPITESSEEGVVEFILNFAKYFLRKNFKLVGKMEVKKEL
jgi:hypothetical protein